MADTASTWASIREGVSDVERLIGRKQYNLAMVKSRQTLETMVRALAARHDTEFTDLKDTIDALAEARVLTSATADHYHKIRMIGNRAIHENDDNPSGASTAYHLLSQELTTFANDYAPDKGAQRSRAATRRQAQPSDEKTEQSVKSAAHSTSTRDNKTVETIFKIMIPVLVLVLIVAILNFVIKKNKIADEETEAELQVAIETVQAPRPTEPVTEPESVREKETKYVITGDVVNVRTEPNTECEILGQLKAGDEVTYITDYDTEWAEVNYNGETAFINRNYMEKQ